MISARSITPQPSAYINSPEGASSIFVVVTPPTTERPSLQIDNTAQQKLQVPNLHFPYPEESHSSLAEQSLLQNTIPYPTISQVESLLRTVSPIHSAMTQDERIPCFPRDVDVKAERGSGTQGHPGNLRYWKIIIENRKRYRDLGIKGNELQKKKIVEEVAKRVHKVGGRFLRREKGDPHWYEMESKERTEKIQNALREVKNIPEPLRDFARIEHPEVYAEWESKIASLAASESSVHLPRKRTKASNSKSGGDAQSTASSRKRARTHAEVNVHAITGRDIHHLVTALQPDEPISLWSCSLLESIHPLTEEELAHLFGC